MSIFSLFVLAGPLLLLAMAVVHLWSYGPLGWVASVLLLAAVAAATWWSCRAALRWWHSTKAPVRPSAPAKGRPTGPPTSTRV